MKTVIDAVNEFKGEYPYAEPSIVHGDNDQGWGDWQHNNERCLSVFWQFVCTKEEFNQCVREMIDYRPEPKPIYTQAMADNGELPSVGMECLLKRIALPDARNIHATVLFISDEFVVYYDKHEEKERAANKQLFKFKPLTPPIELIDGKAYQLDYKGAEFNGIYSDIDNNGLSDRFIINNGHIVASYCTNIVLLTPEVTNHD